MKPYLTAPQVEELLENQQFGFLRIAGIVPFHKVGDIESNTSDIIALAKEAAANHAEVIIFPELAVTGYSNEKLFHQKLLQNAAVKALARILDETEGIGSLIFVGLPLAIDNALFNCAAVIQQGRILGVIVKTYIPGYGEFYEPRYFSSALDLSGKEIMLCGQKAPIGNDLLFRSIYNPNIVVSGEICEDGWLPFPPSVVQALRGAIVTANLSASNETVGKASFRRNTLIPSRSAINICTYAYVSAGPGESTTDLVFGGHTLISENGSSLLESKLFPRENKIYYADTDIERLVTDRINQKTFKDNSRAIAGLPALRFVDARISELDTSVPLIRTINPHPFHSFSKEELDEACECIFGIQVAGLAKRIESSRAKHLILGLSGGIDSSMTLIVAVQAADMVGLPRENIICFSMPGFGTTKRTKNNSRRLAKVFGVTHDERNKHIRDLSKLVLRKIGHDGKTEDITFENVQARGRTYLLFSKANKEGGLVLGTGNMTEAAKGCCTFNGDHISSYNVNCTVPKTLSRFILNWYSENRADKQAATVLKKILGGPISAELKTNQTTEDTFGPQELTDFFLYEMMRWGTRPRKILYLASVAFKGKYDLSVLHYWLVDYYKKFWSQQWKRSVAVDGPQVGSVSLSPRGKWRMPSDAEVTLWLSDLGL